MAYPDLEEARRQHTALRDLFSRHSSEWNDKDGLRKIDALRKVQELCWAASAAVDDAHCREEIGIVADYAAEMFSHREHRKWESESMPGAEFLRLQILSSLDAFNSRLYSIHAIRRAAARQPPPRPFAPQS